MTKFNIRHNPVTWDEIKALCIDLDVYLTKAGREARAFYADRMDPTLFAIGAEWYLGDGGYSRMIMRRNGELVLTSNSIPRTRARWDDPEARRLRKAIEKGMKELYESEFETDPDIKHNRPKGNLYFPRYHASYQRVWYHHPYSRGFTPEGGIKAYPPRKSDSPVLYDWRGGKIGDTLVWLDPEPRTGAVAIDVSLLPDWENLFRFTGQAEGYAVYFGDIPPEAIIERDVRANPSSRRNPKMFRAGMKVQRDDGAIISIVRMGMTRTVKGERRYYHSGLPPSSLIDVWVYAPDGKTVQAHTTATSMEKLQVVVADILAHRKFGTRPPDPETKGNPARHLYSPKEAEQAQELVLSAQPGQWLKLTVETETQYTWSGPGGHIKTIVVTPVQTPQERQAEGRSHVLLVSRHRNKRGEKVYYSLRQQGVLWLTGTGRNRRKFVLVAGELLAGSTKSNPDLKEMRWYVIRGRTAPQFEWSLQTGGEAPAKLTLLHTKDGWFESAGNTLYKLEETASGRYLYRYGAQIGKPTRRWYVETIELLDDVKKNPEKPKVVFSGLVVIEYFDDMFHIMLPTGEVWMRPTVKEAEDFAKKWGKTHSEKRGSVINVLRIDWRGQAAVLARQAGVRGVIE